MKPTVSLSSTGPQSGSCQRRVRVSSVAKSLSSANFVGTGQRVQQRALAGVGVADERDRHPVGAGGHFALLAAKHFVEVAAEIGDSPFDEPTVCFQLLFARATHADAGLDARQVGPHPLEPRERVFELRELDGEPGFVRLGSRRENIEDHFGAVEHLDVERLFQIADLGGREVVVEDDGVGIGGTNHFLELLELALAEIGGLIGGRTPLREPPHHFRTGRFDQTGQLIENLVVTRLVRQEDADQDGRLTLLRPVRDRCPSLEVGTP